MSYYFHFNSFKLLFPRYYHFIVIWLPFFQLNEAAESLGNIVKVLILPQFRSNVKTRVSMFGYP